MFCRQHIAYWGGLFCNGVSNLMNNLNIPPLSERTLTDAKPLASQEVSCHCCGMLGMCEEAGLNHDTHMLDQVVNRRTPLARDAVLHRAGDPFTKIYAVKSGALAAVGEEVEGGRKIFAFYFPGDTLGLDAIADGCYLNTVVALEKSSICELNYDHVSLLGEQQDGFNQQLIQAMSERLKLERWATLLLGAQSTEQRLASFMIYISTHLKARNLPHLVFRLPMTRQDIADYLGLAKETVSRAFSGLQKKDVLMMRGRNTHIIDLQSLYAQAALPPEMMPLSSAAR